jgi:tRNA G18 (ribose-2'-O)-methylase SpoU
LGAEDSVLWEYVEDTKDVVNRLHAEGYKVFAVEQTENSISLEKLSLNKEEKYAIILGNEVKGVQQEVVDLCDETVEIPQFGTKHSLNVSVAGALTIWNIFTQLKLQ